MTSIFSFFHNVFFYPIKDLIIILATDDFLSANVFTVDQAKILLISKELMEALLVVTLTHYQTTNFRLFQTERVCR